MSESFRDSIATVNDKGKRVSVFPKKQKGKFYTARTILSIVLLALLFGIPFIKVNGHPFVLLDVLGRKFIIFGLSFGPQDIYLFVLAMITLIVFVVLFTAIYGRIFCGWVCPQTIFMEMVFRKIEYWIDGDAPAQKVLKKSPWTGTKLFKRTFKHLIFFAIAFLIANTFVAYFVGIEKLFRIVTSPPSEHLSGFIAVIFFSIGFYFVFSFFREQACTIVCPYGRLQGVLLDPNSIVVAYDYTRGEPRKGFNKSEKRTAGDCVSCNLCVSVCPTGIDIRNGTQLECVNCTSCIDACDYIMEKVKLPKGLIRYDSLNGIKTKSKKIFTPRVISYSAILGILFTVLIVLLTTRSDIDASLLRKPGMLSQELPDNKVSNIYTVKFANKTFDVLPIELILNNKDAELKLIGNTMEIQPQSVLETELMVIFPKDKIRLAIMPLTIKVLVKGEEVIELKTTFVGPNK